jgi:hypothetical protein
VTSTRDNALGGASIAGAASTETGDARLAACMEVLKRATDTFDDHRISISHSTAGRSRTSHLIIDNAWEWARIRCEVQGRRVDVVVTYLLEPAPVTSSRKPE